MKQILILMTFFCAFTFQVNAQGVAINTDNSAADASAALDVQLTKGGQILQHPGLGYPVPVLELNNNVSNRIFGTGINARDAWMHGTMGAKGRGSLHTILYLDVGDEIKIKGQNGTTSTSLTLHSHMSCRWVVRKL